MARVTDQLCEQIEAILARSPAILGHVVNYDVVIALEPSESGPMVLAVVFTFTTNPLLGMPDLGAFEAMPLQMAKQPGSVEALIGRCIEGLTTQYQQILQGSSSTDRSPLLP